MRKKIAKSDIVQLMRFGVVGSSNAVIDFGVLNLLLWLYPTSDTWKSLSYNTLAVLLASTNSFIFNKYWTFHQRNPVTWSEVYRFFVLAFSTALMNDLLMWLLGVLFPRVMTGNLIGANVLKLGAIIGTMSISFFGMRLWVFLQKKQVAEEFGLPDYETMKLPAIDMAYDVNLFVGGVLKPIHDMDTVLMRAVKKPTPRLVAMPASQQSGPPSTSRF